MKTRLPSATKKLLLLGILCASLSGCVVYDSPHPYYGGGYYGEHHYWHDRDGWR